MNEDAFEVSAVEASKRVGTTLRGKWHLLRLIGVGGMGAVYEGCHRNGMRGAVKVLDPVLARTRDFRERFLREGRLANEVAHEGAVHVLDDDETDDGSAFLVMELLDGATLDVVAMQRGGTLPPEELARYMAQVLETLAVAHARGIVHRDIKPENLLLTKDGVVKVLDFGIAHASGASSASQRVTQAGQPIGTPAFMSPEQARGRWEEVDARTDVYSLGATMFNLATGETVHTATTVAELLVAVITQPARPVRQVAEIPHALAAVIDKALAYDKHSRFESVDAMRSALELAYREMSGKPIPATPHLARHADGARHLAAAQHVLHARMATTCTPGRRSHRLVAAATVTGLLALGATVFAAAERPHSGSAARQLPKSVVSLSNPAADPILVTADLPPTSPSTPRGKRMTSDVLPIATSARSDGWREATSRHSPLYQHRY